MNREQRRRLIRKIPEYKKILKSTTKKSVEDLEEALKKKWGQDDESLNYGNKSYEYNNSEDEIYND